MALKVLLHGCDQGALAALAPLIAPDEAVPMVSDPRDRAAVQAEVVGADTVVFAVPDPASPFVDAFELATAGLYNIVTTPGLRQVILLSSLAPFERYPPEWQVTEMWSPRPSLAPADLLPFLAESLTREVAHELPVQCVCLRLGDVVDTDVGDRRAVHIEDVAQAVRLALQFDPAADEPRTGWRVFHIVGAGDTRFPLGLAAVPSHFPNGGRCSALGYSPEHDLATGAPYDRRDAQAVSCDLQDYAGDPARVALFGAAGPFGAAIIDALGDVCPVRAIDRVDYHDAIAGMVPQQPGAPVPAPLAPPHEVMQADITDLDQVRAALEGVDCVVNLAVVRDEPLQAFRVNTLGAYNVLKAACEAGIRRVVLTGPSQLFNPMNGGYSVDFHVGEDIPQRPGAHMYMLSKFLGQELARIFSRETGMEVPALVWGYFHDSREREADRLGGHPFTVSWADTGTAMAAAVRVPSFSEGFAVIPVQGEMPHGKHPATRAERLLGWTPAGDLDGLWQRPGSGWQEGDDEG